ncbi:hypothetical protein TBLA_0I00300 [Henningerozyma blattae CBS 6284]|uniref:BZIP domain-containing protein n=1 Tax=Henningerozyma blattae (strain ATCC 34711 / CBS 6284 / DSM 70876 / NBRC 10599 / NRRL Y-10934 / UCD 77-7) TaxID=1071380 RepID=I2H8J3_HENB6|nr:hypothetical protein TBLA_0I00300 [Tetrapisispora blattae CBS 6284]CCH62695.1 hypothetical protein TBLA_0I00300 [Tetrapisispora blattae CBS 6284]
MLPSAHCTMRPWPTRLHVRAPTLLQTQTPAAALQTPPRSLNKNRSTLPISTDLSTLPAQLPNPSASAPSYSNSPRSTAPRDPDDPLGCDIFSTENPSSHTRNSSIYALSADSEWQNPGSFSTNTFGGTSQGNPPSPFSRPPMKSNSFSMGSENLLFMAGISPTTERPPQQQQQQQPQSLGGPLGGNVSASVFQDIPAQLQLQPQLPNNDPRRCSVFSDTALGGSHANGGRKYSLHQENRVHKKSLSHSYEPPVPVPLPLQDPCSSEVKDTESVEEKIKAKKKAQNRAAQKAFRERKEAKLKELEKKLEQSERDKEALERKIEELRRLNMEINAENRLLLKKNDSIYHHQPYLHHNSYPAFINPFDNMKPMQNHIQTPMQAQMQSPVQPTTPAPAQAQAQAQAPAPPQMSIPINRNGATVAENIMLPIQAVWDYLHKKLSENKNLKLDNTKSNVLNVYETRNTIIMDVMRRLKEWDNNNPHQNSFNYVYPKTVIDEYLKQSIDSIKF